LDSLNKIYKQLFIAEDIEGTEEILALIEEQTGEDVFLDTISALYERHRNTTDPDKRKELYKKIDEYSLKAAAKAIPNEYDKITTSIGASRTNAYTWVEQTVYTNEIPSNEIEKWLKIESERFSELVLRLFHTELEAVYEEFNRGQDSDARKAWRELNKALFQNHPYGTQTTIGTGEHLKSPSMVKIHEFFDTYYV
ncbi:MAG: insulinase family protein, partial [Bacteroidetes bacterium]|nr:insulinase family protein [Bacteroidota bacterium]